MSNSFKLGRRIACGIVQYRVSAMKRGNIVNRWLLKSMTLTFPVSAYLWTIGVVSTGILYAISSFLGSWEPADIPFVPDLVWGVLLMVTGLSMIWAMIMENGKLVNALSFFIAIFATTLFIASVLDQNPVPSISAGLTSVYYSYSYLCSHLITEWRSINDKRLEDLRDELDF